MRSHQRHRGPAFSEPSPISFPIPNSIPAAVRALLILIMRRGAAATATAAAAAAFARQWSVDKTSTFWLSANRHRFPSRLSLSLFVSLTLQ